MRKVIEWTLVSADGVFDDPVGLGFMQYQDDAYLRDPWAGRMHAIPKYVFSSTLGSADWNNSTLVRGDAVAEVTRLKQQDGGDLLIFGHGRLGETLLRAQLTDVIDLSVYPVLAGRGQQFFRDGQAAKVRLAAVKTFSKIVKMTYELQH
jgi:dihydrofolate reductase